MQGHLQKSDLINLAWDGLARNLSNHKLSMIIKKQVIEKWVDIRASEVLTRRVSALLDDLSLFASRIVILRDVSPPFSGKILMVHIVAKSLC